MPAPRSFLAEFSRVNNPNQLQVYGASPGGGMRLQLVAGITDAPTIDDQGRVHFVTNAVFRKIGDSWQTESAGDLVLPGEIKDMVLRITLEGRLILDLGAANVVIAIFPSDDTRIQTQYSNDLTIIRMDPSVITKTARPSSIVSDTERPPDDC